MTGPPRGALGRSSGGDPPACSGSGSGAGGRGVRYRGPARSAPIASDRSPAAPGRGDRRTVGPSASPMRSAGTMGAQGRGRLGSPRAPGSHRSPRRRATTGAAARGRWDAGSRRSGTGWSGAAGRGDAGPRTRRRYSSAESSACQGLDRAAAPIVRVVEAGRFAGGSRRAAGAPAAGGGSAAAGRGPRRRTWRPDRTGPTLGQQAGGDVVPHRPGGDPGQVGQFGERVARVVWHGGK